MHNPYRNSLLIGIALYALTACSSVVFPPEEVREGAVQNRSNLQRLEVGMSQSQTLNIMGSPYRKERFPRYAKHLDFWLYFTSGKGGLDPGYTAASYTYLAFEGDFLRGWGADYEMIPIKKDHPLRQPLAPGSEKSIDNP